MLEACNVDVMLWPLVAGVVASSAVGGDEIRLDRQDEVSGCFLTGEQERLEIFGSQEAQAQSSAKAAAVATFERFLACSLWSKSTLSLTHDELMLSVQSSNMFWRNSWKHTSN